MSAEQFTGEWETVRAAVSAAVDTLSQCRWQLLAYARSGCNDAQNAVDSGQLPTHAALCQYATQWRMAASLCSSEAFHCSCSISMIRCEAVTR